MGSTGKFERQFVEKHTRPLPGFDDKAAKRAID